MLVHGCACISRNEGDNMKWLKNKLNEEKWFPNTFAICAGVILAFLLYNLPYITELFGSFWNVIAPVFIGVIFAYIMDPIARFLEKKVFKKAKKRRLVRCISVYLSVIITLLLLVLLVFAFIPPIVESITSVIESSEASLQSLMENTEAWINAKSLAWFNKPISFEEFDNAYSWIASQLSEITVNTDNLAGVWETSLGVGSSIMTSVLAFIIAIYYMLYKESLQELTKKFFRRILEQKKYDTFMGFCFKCDRILLKYIECDILEGIFVGVGNAIFMAAFGMKYISLISVVVGVTNLAPTFGPIVGALFGAFLLLLVNPWHALWFLIFTLVLQTIDGYVLKPKLFGDTLGVSPVLILVSIILGGRIFGAIGILLAIPASAIVQCFVKDYLLKKKE